MRAELKQKALQPVTSVSLSFCLFCVLLLVAVELPLKCVDWAIYFSNSYISYLANHKTVTYEVLNLLLEKLEL